MSEDLVPITLAAHQFLPHNVGGVQSSIVPSNRESMVQLFRCLQTEDLKMEEMIGNVIDIQDIVIHVVVLEDKVTKEPRDCLRTVLVTPKGERISCVSDGVVQSVKALVAAFGPPPWNPSMRCTIKNPKARSGMKFYMLDLE